MKIRDALPRIFQKAYPAIDPKTEILPAMSLLRFHEIDALPLAFEPGSSRTKDRQKAVYGFSSLARLMLLKPKDIASFLKKPCEVASEPIASVSADRDMSSLLDTYARTRFGFARVEDKKKVGALAGLTDLLELYETGGLATELNAVDVGTPIVSVKADTPLRNALQMMFEKRHRRIFISGGREFVSDRTIIDHIFSPGILSAMANRGDDVLNIPVSSVGMLSAKEVEEDTPLADAAKELRAQHAGQCLVFDGHVVTPWDIVMKPWNQGALKLASASDSRRSKRN